MYLLQKRYLFNYCQKPNQDLVGMYFFMLIISLGPTFYVLGIHTWIPSINKNSNVFSTITSIIAAIFFVIGIINWKLKTKYFTWFPKKQFQK